MLLSFIIPAYNAEEFLGKCVHSIAKQIENHDCEIIIVNDGSRDDTGAICDALSKEYGFVSYFTNENNGPGYSRNYGLNKAKGEYIWYIDADDYLEEGALEQVLPKIEDNLDLYVVGFQHHSQSGAILKKMTFNENVYTPVEFLEKQYYINYVWCKIIKKSLLIDNNISFREDVRGPEDFHFSLRVLSLVQKLKTIDVLCYNYIVQPNSLMNLRTEEHMINLANYSIVVGNDLKSFINNSIVENERVFFEQWLNNYLYGLLFSLFRYNHYSSKFVSKAIDRLKETKNYPVNMYNNRLKRKMFMFLANIKPLFILTIYKKRFISAALS